jgi:hypothetical protein
MRQPLHVSAVAILSALWLFVPPANAQNQVESSSILEQKIDAMANAMGRVRDLHMLYQQRLATAAPSDHDRILDEGNTALTKAVTDQGLSIEEYTVLLNLAQNDPAFGDKLRQRLQLPGN